MGGSVTSKSQKSSSSVGSQSSAFLDKLEAEASGADILDHGSAFQAGVFGTLYTVTKEKYNTGWRFLVLKLVLDYIQLFTLTFTKEEPWRFNSQSLPWKIVSVVNINQIITPLGYNFFMGLLYVMIGLLCLMVGLSLWVAWCFKSRSFPFVWPIKVLRVYANLFFQILDVLTLTLFQMPFDCRFIGYPKDVYNTLNGYPDVKCSSFPHLIHLITSGASLLVFVSCALLNLGADFELSPLDKGYLAIANSGVEMRAFIIKFAMTFVAYAIGWQKVRLVLLLILSALLTWLYLRWSPHLLWWVNHLRVGLYTSILLVSALAVALVYPPDDPAMHDQYYGRITLMLWVLMGPAALLGAGASYLRLNTWSAYVLKRFRNASLGEKARRIYKFGDPREVEIVARVCRKWTDQHREVLDKRAVKEGEIIIKAGLQLFPGRSYMLILYSNYLIDVLDNSPTGYSQMAAAKQANPDWTQRFAIFAREQEQLQRMSSARGGESGVDLVSYVEYQKNHRLVIRAHKDALVALRTFWQALMHNNVKFTALASALNEIERTVLKAEAAYKLVLSRYPTNAKLMRTYARFLENVVNDPWKASKYFTEAERLAEAQEADEAAGAELSAAAGDTAGIENRLLHRVDERVNAVFIINANGIIQMANKNATTLLGYSKNDLDGKNINVIMPPPFSQRHNKYVRQHIHTGRESILNTVVSLPALHKDRYVIPVRVGVSKVSGAAESSTFMGVIEPIPLERNEAHVYLLPGGTVAAVDKAFVDWFAMGLEDTVAQHLAELAADEASAAGIRQLVDRASVAPRATATSTGMLSPAGAPTGAAAGSTQTGMAADPAATVIAHLQHKYAPPVRVTVKVERIGLGKELLLMARLVRNDPPANLVLVDGKGRIRFITTDLASGLGASPEGLLRQPISDLLPQPWNYLHFSSLFKEAESSMGNVGIPIYGSDPHSENGGERTPHHHHRRRSSVTSTHSRRVSTHNSMPAYVPPSAVAMGPHESKSQPHKPQFGPGSAAAGHVTATTAGPPGSCLAGATVVLGSSSKVQDYYKVQVSATEEDETGKATRVVMVSKSNLQTALNERRLSLVVDASSGVVLEAGDSPQWLFGFAPDSLVGRSISDVVAALRPVPPATGTPTDPPPRHMPHHGLTTSQLLCQLAATTMAVNGASWRVGVMPPVDQSDLDALGLLKEAFLSKQTRATVMEVDVLVPTEGSLLVEDDILNTCSDAGMGPGAPAVAAAPATASACTSDDGREHGDTSNDLASLMAAHTLLGNGALIGGDGSVQQARGAFLGKEQVSGRFRHSRSFLQERTFREMHDKGHLSVEAAASIETGLMMMAAGAVSSATTGAPGGRRLSWSSLPGGGLRLRINLWRADTMTSALEVDGQGTIHSVAHPKLHQAGLMFGIETAMLPRKRLQQLVALPGGPAGTIPSLFEQPASSTRKRGALKSSSKEQAKVGPLHELKGTHLDGQPLDLAVQVVLKDASSPVSTSSSSRVYVYLKLRNPAKADSDSLLRALHSVAPQRLWTVPAARHSAWAAPSPAPVPAITLPAKPAATAVQDKQAEDLDDDQAQLERGEAVGTAGAAAGVPDAFLDHGKEEEGVEAGDPLRKPAELGSEEEGLQQQGGAGSGQPHAPGHAGGCGLPGGAGLGLHRNGNPQGEADSKDSDVLLAASARKEGGHRASVTSVLTDPEVAGTQRTSESSDVSDPKRRLMAIEHQQNSEASSSHASSDSSSESSNSDRQEEEERAGPGGFNSPGRRPALRSSTGGWSVDNRSTAGSQAGAGPRLRGGEPAPSPLRRASMLGKPPPPPGNTRLSRASYSKEALGFPDLPGEGIPVGGSVAGTPTAAARMSSGGMVGLRGPGGEGAKAAMGVEDADEGGSQGSGMSGMDDLEPSGGHHADYRRGKRFKKLSGILGSASVQKAASDFRWQALLANLAQVLSNLVSFILLTLLLHAQIKSVDKMSYTADGLLLGHKLFIDMAVLDNVHRGLFPNTSWYTNASMEQYAASFARDLADFSEHHSTSYLQTGGGRISSMGRYNPNTLLHTWNYPAHTVAEFYSVTPPRTELRATSLWELGNQIVERATDVHHMHLQLAAAMLLDPHAAAWSALHNPTQPSNGDPYTDLIVSRHVDGAYRAVNTTDALGAAARVLDSGSMSLAVSGASSDSSTDGTPPVTAASEATRNISVSTITTNAPSDSPTITSNSTTAVTYSGSAGGFWEMLLPDGSVWMVPELRTGLSWSDAWRFVLCSGPVQLMKGYHDTMLALVDRAVKDSNAVNRVQLILMLVEGCAVATLLVVYMWWLQHRVTEQRYRVYGVFLAVPVGMIRALASRTISISQGSDSEEDSDEEEYNQQPVEPARMSSMNGAQLVVRQESMYSGGTIGSFAAGRMAAVMSFLPRFLRRFSMAGGFESRSMRASSNGTGGGRRNIKRRLVHNSHDSLKLLIPFVAWGITICIIYAAGYIYLNRVQAPVNLLSVISSCHVALHRLLLYSLMTASEVAAPARSMLRGLLAQELNRFKVEWDVMLYGSNSTTAEIDRRFGRINLGVSFMASSAAHVLYRMLGCDTFGIPDVDCPSPSNPYYAVTGHGLSYMVDRMVEDVEGLLAEPLDVANINSTRLAYIMTIGVGPLEAAMEVVFDNTLQIVDSYYKVVDQLHVAAMVLSWVLVVAFMFFMLRPFLRRNRGETTRIAKMLAQLPTEVDIEGLVYRLLLAPSAMRRSNRRASMASLVADDPVLAAKLAMVEAAAEQLGQSGGGNVSGRYSTGGFGSVPSSPLKTSQGAGRRFDLIAAGGQPDGIYGGAQNDGSGDAGTGMGFKGLAEGKGSWV